MIQGISKKKINCLSRNIYYYDKDKARQDLLNLINEYDLKEKLGQIYDWESEEDSINDIIDEILTDFDSNRGIGSKGYDVASEHISDFLEDAKYIGREETGILELYMLAFELATKQLES